MKITNPKFKAKFVDALISGRYKKITGELTKEHVRGAYCLMGVAGRVAGVPKKRIAEMGGELDSNILKRIGISYDLQSKLIGENDGTEKSFKELGCWIQKNL